MDEVRLRLAINDLGDLLGKLYKGWERQVCNVAREVLGKYAYCPEPVRASMFDAAASFTASLGIEPPLSDSSFGIIKGNIGNIFAMEGDEYAKVVLARRFVDRLISSSREKEQDKVVSLRQKAHSILSEINSNLSPNGEGLKLSSEVSEPTFPTTHHSIRSKVQNKPHSQLKTPLPALPRVSWSFINDANLRKIISRDYGELKKHRAAQTYKAIIIMCGSILEAILISALMKQSRTDIDARYVEMAQEERWTRQPAKAPDLDEEKWTLNQLITIASKLKILHDDGQIYAVLVKDYRNLVHPMKEVRKGIKPTRETASAMLILFRNVIAQVK